MTELQPESKHRGLEQLSAKCNLQSIKSGHCCNFQHEHNNKHRRSHKQKGYIIDNDPYIHSFGFIVLSDFISQYVKQP